MSIQSDQPVSVEPVPSSNNAQSTPSFRAAFVTLYDAQDVTKMSGTGYNISQSFLESGLALDFVGSLDRQIRPMNVARHAFNRFVLRQNDHPQRDPAFLKNYARQVETQLSALDVNVVFGSGGLPVSYIETDLPLVIWTDCTFANLLNYYGKYSNLSKRTIRDGHQADANLYERCEQAIFASSWAAESAINDYGLSRDKATIVSRGANVPGGRTESDIQALINKRSNKKCILHFVGVDWKRKGGQIAADAVKELITRGIDAELRVVGVEPEFDGPIPEYVKPYGRISKATPDGMKRFTDLLGEAHFLIVPTRAEAYGIMYLEASAFGVPSLATKTGGVPSAVIDGVNGVLFDLDAPAGQYADAVERLFTNTQAYNEMAMGAFRDHTQRTNWGIVAQQAIGVLQKAVDARSGTTN